ncbi:hypothetical protein GCM10009682_19210 [Luedemannella flava]|uniref:DUF3592 domain-containing protein n=1 Tax=Luedemannella flava TaxID=349316 RepID=A0ABP4Y3C5_9ACTN
MANGRRTEEQRFTIRHALIMLTTFAFGVALLVGGLIRFNDHRVLGDRGVVTTATVLELGRKSAEVRFVSLSGETVTARVHDQGSGPYEVGGPMSVSYDPDDPAGRVEDVDGTNAAITRWLYTVSGLGIIGLNVFGAWWWSTRGRTAGARARRRN